MKNSKVILLNLILLTSCYNETNSSISLPSNISSTSTIEDSSTTNNQTLFEKYHLPTNSIDYCEIVQSSCGDSKFTNGYVITNINSKLTIFNRKLEIVNSYDINDNWQDAVFIENKYYIISGNYNNETILTTLDSSFNLLESKTIFKKENLCIDPSIFYNNGIFYITYTEISGNVNNSNPNEDTGNYSIRVYSSTDLNEFNYLTSIESERCNYEDVELFIYNGKLAAMYEEEPLNKATSTIVIRYTDINLFDTRIELVSDGDDEPAKLLEKGNYYYLFYSCDKAHPKESYDGSDIYVNVYTKSFELLDNIMIPSRISGIHLYDIYEEQDSICFVSAINYYTSRDLVIETIAY